jgi:hypothetical protein
MFTVGVPCEGAGPVSSGLRSSEGVEGISDVDIKLFSFFQVVVILHVRPQPRLEPQGLASIEMCEYNGNHLAFHGFHWLACRPKPRGPVQSANRLD